MATMSTRDLNKRQPPRLSSLPRFPASSSTSSSTYNSPISPRIGQLDFERQQDHAITLFHGSAFDDLSLLSAPHVPIVHNSQKPASLHSDSSTASRPASSHSCYSPIDANMRDEIREKGRSFMNFVKVKEPSQVALEAYAEAQRRPSSQMSRSSQEKKQQTLIDNAQQKLAARRTSAHPEYFADFAGDHNESSSPVEPPVTRKSSRRAGGGRTYRPSNTRDRSKSKGASEPRTAIDALFGGSRPPTSPVHSSNDSTYASSVSSYTDSRGLPSPGVHSQLNTPVTPLRDAFGRSEAPNGRVTESPRVEELAPTSEDVTPWFVEEFLPLVGDVSAKGARHERTISATSSGKTLASLETEKTDLSPKKEPFSRLSTVMEVPQGPEKAEDKAPESSVPTVSPLHIPDAMPSRPVKTSPVKQTAPTALHPSADIPRSPADAGPIKKKAAGPVLKLNIQSPPSTESNAFKVTIISPSPEPDSEDEGELELPEPPVELEIPDEYDDSTPAQNNGILDHDLFVPEQSQDLLQPATAEPESKRSSYNVDGELIDHFIADISRIDLKPRHERSRSCPAPSIDGNRVAKPKRSMTLIPIITRVDSNESQQTESASLVESTSAPSYRPVDSVMDGEDDGEESCPSPHIPARKSSLGRSKSKSSVFKHDRNPSKAGSSVSSLGELPPLPLSPASIQAPDTNKMERSIFDSIPTEYRPFTQPKMYSERTLPDITFLGGEGSDWETPESPSVPSTPIIVEPVVKDDVPPVPAKNPSRERLQQHSSRENLEESQPPSSGPSPAKHRPRFISIEAVRSASRASLTPESASPRSPVNFSRPRSAASLRPGSAASGHRPLSPTPEDSVAPPSSSVPVLEVIPSSRNGSQESLASVAPSVLSVSWQKTSKERLGLGGWIKKSSSMPWETDRPESRTGKLFSNPLTSDKRKGRRSILFGRG